MLELSCFINRACAEARSAATRGWDPSAGADSSPGRPAPSATRTMHRAMDDDPPARKAAQAVTYATQDESSPVGTSAAVSVVQYSAPPAPVVCPFPSGRRRPTLPLPHFASQNVAPDNAQSLSVATQMYPSSPGRRPLALIWPILTRSVPGLPCPAPRCPTFHHWYQWYRWTRCLRMLWTGGL